MQLEGTRQSLCYFYFTFVSSCTFILYQLSAYNDYTELRNMKRRTIIGIVLGLLVAAALIAVIVVVVQNNNTSSQHDRNFCELLVIAHRGASGYVPEHTLAAYAVAATMGADYVEPDVVMTKDGHLIARHDNELGLTTDVSQRPEFASRLRTQSVDGNNVTGWFTEDFTLEEIKTLRAIERIPKIRPGNARMDYAFEVPTMEEIVNLVKGLEISLKRPIGIYPEIKHPTHFQRLGLPMERPLVNLLHLNGYHGPEAPIIIQSFEVSNLKILKEITDIRLIQLLAAPSTRQPFDQNLLGTGLTYSQMATAEGLREIASYAHAVGPDKLYILPREGNNTLGRLTTFVVDAHAVGLKVHPYTFRSENEFLPTEFQSDNSSADALGNAEGEIRAFLNAGIDGLFADQPDDAVRARSNLGYCQE
ncbi:unnamed protein product [Arctia plantaginis]|uniref:glycerophosphodiester phosphodiesterase n=1 Tax=Arctia plantaginis TaxID=874455 RepID=A0A8S0ZW44_ARCPL|nr:unnamed protein product [Arctia plantaginis]